MSCASFDLKEYALGEGTAEERRAMELHLPTCASCFEEVERLGIVQSAMLTLRDEEIPRRIAFVSDKVFAPRWYQRLWQSGPVAGFASAAMLAGAILVHGFQQPAVPVAQPSMTETEIHARVEAEVAKRLDEVIAKAVSASIAQQEKVFSARLASTESRIESAMAGDRAAFAENYRVLNTRYMNAIRTNQYALADFGGRQ
jgi:anti-sigma factor RsiW